MDPLDIFLVAGEKSGDDRGSELALSLLAENPHLRLGGVAGPKMRAAGVRALINMEELQVMGFIDVLLALPRLLPLFYKIKKAIYQTRPSKVITIDYPGLNLRLMKSLWKEKHPAKRIHYVCPSVWIWGKKRIPLMAQCLDELLALFPFEPPLFKETSLKVTYVGHPLAKAITPRPSPPSNLVALFPGSRIKEVERNLPIQLAAIPKEYPIAISCASSHLEKRIRALAPHAQLVYDPYELMRNARYAIAKSGTVTLELALHGVPAVVTYAVTPLDRFIVKRLLKINFPYYALPNILSGKELFPECFGPAFNVENIKNALEALIKNEAEIEKGCSALRSALLR